MHSQTPFQLQPASATSTTDPWHGWRGAALAGGLTCVLALMGILARPVDFLSVLWPANVGLAGLLIRHPTLARRADVWAAAGLGYLAADLLTGSTLLKTVWLTSANLVGVALCVILFLQLNEPERQLRRQTSALRLLGICSASALISAIVGGSTGPVLFDAELLPSIALWLGGELVSYVLLLPTILSFPVRGPYTVRQVIGWREKSPLWVNVLPVLTVGVALTASVTIGGPGALAFVVPALLWCALVYSMFFTSMLCTVACVTLILHTASSGLEFVPSHWLDVLSLRVGITLLAIGPLAAACTRTARREVMQQLDHAVNYDYLTGAMSRTALFQQGQGMLQRLTHDQAPVAVLMLDLDRFKQINDTYGHATGDQVLLTFSRLVSDRLRPEDLLGRLGGEEFVALLPNLQYGEAIVVAERLCDAVRRHNFQRSGLRAPLYVTVSIGLAYYPRAQNGDTLELLMQPADKSLYQAKSMGRDRVAYGIYLDRVWNRAPSSSEPVSLAAHDAASTDA